MAALITRADIENELRVTLKQDEGYTDSVITGICNWAHARLRRKTNRTTFTGDAAEDAKLAEINFAIDRLTTSNRDIVKVAISSISENGTSISFTNGKTIQYYHDDADRLVADLKLEGAYVNTMTFPDTEDVHTGDESSILY